MKRPGGFDKPAPEPAPRRGGRAPRPAQPARPSQGQPPRSSRPAAPARPADRSPSARTDRNASQSATGSGRARAASPAGKAARPAKAVDPVKAARKARQAERRTAGRDLRRATKDRKRYEKAEVRRFTVRARARRAAIVGTLGVIGALVVLGLVALFSPILALRTIVVQGTARVDANAVQHSLDGLLGTPLALIGDARIDDALRAFPIIQSYSTELIPPGTMVVNIVERQPIAAIQQPDDSYAFVDAAGVTVAQGTDRMAGVPLVVGSGVTVPNPTFNDAVEVLLALPAALRAKVDTITAKSHDDVTLTLSGAAQTVEWGSADDSDRKAELLTALQQLHAGQRGTFDVSAIDDGIFRAG